MNVRCIYTKSKKNLTNTWRKWIEITSTPSSTFNKIAGLAGENIEEIAFYMDSEGKQHNFSNA